MLRIWGSVIVDMFILERVSVLTSPFETETTVPKE
jgi:hypothetical protein